jgi:hypothetical protein
MIKDTDIAWLAGIVDGEGCICGHWGNRGRYATGGSLSVEIRIEATSAVMISKVQQICQSVGIIVSVDLNRWRPKATKPACRVNVRRREAVVKFLEMIRPYLVVKAAEADLVLSWYAKWGDQRGKPNGRATAMEKIVMFDALRSLKKTA